MHNLSTKFIVAFITVLAGIAFVGTWVFAMRSMPEDRGNVPQIVATSTSVSSSTSASMEPFIETESARGTNPSRVNMDSDTKNVSTKTAKQPVRLEIPAVTIRAQVQRVGLTGKGEMGIPSNFKDVGWYSQGVIPGDFGYALIDGHVDNALGLPGVFSRLEEVKVGDEVVVTRNDGSTLVFIVTESVWYDYAKVPMNEMVNQKHVQGIKLITCGGIWIQDRKTYDQRLVVTAVLKE